MGHDFSEKRSFFRMAVECQLEYTENGHDEVRTGHVKNISGDGVLFQISHAVNVGTEMNIIVKAGSNLTPPLHATVEVIRCHLTDDESYEVAATMKK